MTYNPTKTRTWKSGTTPSTGTPALGSFFEDEFNRLYANDEAIVGNAGAAPPETMKQLYDNKMVNPMSALADLIVGGASGVPGRLGIGSANQQLFVNAAGNGIEWGFGSKVVAYTRDMTAASGDIAYTGAGFKPNNIIVLSAFKASFTLGFGYGTDSKFAIRLFGASLGSVDSVTSTILTLIEDATTTKYQNGILKSLDADGCTITWSKGGTPSAGTGNFAILYLR